MTRRTIVVLLLTLVVGAIDLDARAQVPDGWFVVSAVRVTATGGPGGLFVGSTMQAGAVVPITGLGVDLSPPGPGTTIAHGANCVLRRADGRLFVGEAALPGTPLDIHVVTLNALAVSTDTLVNLGTAATFTTAAGQVPQMAEFPNGDVLIAVNGVLAGGPIPNPGIGIITPGLAVASLPIPLPPLDSVNALAVEPGGTAIYYGIALSGGVTPSPVYRVAYPALSAPVLVATIPGIVSGLTVDRATGDLVVTTFSGLYRLVPATGVVTTITTSAGAPNAVVIEQATGSFLCANSASGSNANRVMRVTPQGSGAPLTTVTPVGWGVPTGIDYAATPRTFGTPTAGQNSYSWSLVANPGGLPTVGNAAFSATILSTPGCAPGIVAMSLGRLQVPLLVGPVAIHIDPALIILVADLVCATTMTLPLPIPLQPSLAGATVFLQAAYFDPAGGAASEGLLITIL